MMKNKTRINKKALEWWIGLDDQERYDCIEDCFESEKIIRLLKKAVEQNNNSKNGKPVKHRVSRSNINKDA